MSNDFDWLDDSGVVIHEVPAIAVHRNSCGQLVIRQRDIYDDGDALIFLNPESAEKLAEAIVKAASPSTAVVTRAAQPSTSSVVTLTDTGDVQHVIGMKGSGAA